MLRGWWEEGGGREGGWAGGEGESGRRREGGWAGGGGGKGRGAQGQEYRQQTACVAVLPEATEVTREGGGKEGCVVNRGAGGGGGGAGGCPEWRGADDG